MLLTYDLDDTLVNRFKMALEISGEKESHIIERAVRTFTANTMEAESQRIKKVSSYQKSPPSSSDIVISEEKSASKAATRLFLWAKRPKQANHKVLRAFFAVESGGTASKSKMEQYYFSDSGQSVESFKQNFHSMCTDSGNAHGKVFIYAGDEVQLAPEISAIAQGLRTSFYSD